MRKNKIRRRKQIKELFTNKQTTKQVVNVKVVTGKTRAIRKPTANEIAPVMSRNRLLQATPSVNIISHPPPPNDVIGLMGLLRQNQPQPQPQGFTQNVRRDEEVNRLNGLIGVLTEQQRTSSTRTNNLLGILNDRQRDMRQRHEAQADGLQGFILAQREATENLRREMPQREELNALTRLVEQQREDINGLARIIDQNRPRQDAQVNTDGIGQYMIFQAPSDSSIENTFSPLISRASPGPASPGSASPRSSHQEGSPDGRPIGALEGETKTPEVVTRQPSPPVSERTKALSHLENVRALVYANVDHMPLDTVGVRLVKRMAKADSERAREAFRRELIDHQRRRINDAKTYETVLRLWEVTQKNIEKKKVTIEYPPDTTPRDFEELTELKPRTTFEKLLGKITPKKIKKEERETLSEPPPRRLELTAEGGDSATTGGAANPDRSLVYGDDINTSSVERADTIGL